MDEVWQYCILECRLKGWGGSVGDDDVSGNADSGDGGGVLRIEEERCNVVSF